jgi:predicted nucleotidyltransferase
MQETDSARFSATLEDVLQSLRVHLPEIYQRYNVKSLGVFGSVVRGEQEEKSDLDTPQTITW